jgi:hypothetical protein
MYLYLISGRVPGDDDDTAQLIPALNEDEAQKIFTADMTDAMDDDARASIIEQHGSAVFICTSIVVGEYTALNMIRVPEGTDWHLSTVHPGGYGLPT